MVIEKKRKRTEPVERKTEIQTTKTSLLRSDEAFPRGGGSVLTPLEYKEATNEAKKDLLFENSTPAPVSAPSRKSVKNKKNGKVEVVRPLREGPKIEGLSYKRLNVDTLVLGQISAISETELTLSLPNNLNGFVPARNISEEYRKTLAEDENDDDDNDSDSDADHDMQKVSTELSLKQMFAVGQWLRASVSSVSRGQVVSGKKQRKSIELSIVPEEVNRGLSSDVLQPKNVLQASIRSVEDHGLVMNTGLNNSSGFIKEKELGLYKLSELHPGQVLLCHVVSCENASVIQLSLDLQKNAKRLKLKGLLNVDAVLPGDGVEIVLADVQPTSFSGKICGLLNATCDGIHAGLLSGITKGPLNEGQKVFGRVLFVDRDSDPKKVGISLLPHILNFTQLSTSPDVQQGPLEAMPVGFSLEQATITHVEPKHGLICDIGIENIPGFVHISRITETKIDALSADTGAYKVRSQHPARIIGYNAVDGMFLLSMEQKILDTKYLNVADVQVGEIIPGIVERFVNGGLLVKISENMIGFVPDTHVADVKLQYPEKKFKEGLSVKCRVLNRDVDRQRVTLTMKKSLVNSEDTIISNYAEVDAGSSSKIGTKSAGIVSKLFDNGALLQFYGGVYGFLPASEMSEAYINNPKDHFRLGQTLSIRVISVDVASEKMTVSCRDPAVWTEGKTDEFESLAFGTIVSGSITEKTADRLVVSISPGNFNATLETGHLADKDFAKCDKISTKLRVGGQLKELVVLGKQNAQKHLLLSMKPSLIRAAQDGNLVTSFEDLQLNKTVTGYIRKATDYGVLVGFAGGLTGLALKHNLSEEYVSNPQSLFSPLQSVEVTVVELDETTKRFQVSFRSSKSKSVAANVLAESVDSADAFAPGKTGSAKVVAVKETQLNIEIETGKGQKVQGRVDISSIFESFDDIVNKRKPLRQFEPGVQLDVKFLGYHDARNHKFLPISHRGSNRKAIMECTARKSEIAAKDSTPFSFADIVEGKMYTAYVNNFSGDCLWVNLSPIVRGRINILELDTDKHTPDEVEEQYPVGAALRCRVIHFTASTKHLDLSEKAVSEQNVTDIKSVRVGSVLTAKITKVSDSALLAQLSPTVAGRIALTDISRDFAQKPTEKFTKNELVEVQVKAIDLPNKRIHLALHGSDIKIVDPEIDSVKNLEVGHKYRGYVKNVSDQGLFVELGRTVTARVKIAEVSDAFVKDWKSCFSVDQLVSGTVTSIDAKSGKVEFSLKKNAKVKQPMTGLSELSIGQVVEGTIKKIEDFGVFIQVTSLSGVSGLCHKSEIADTPVKDINAVYTVGDLVSAKILSIQQEKRRISFGLKASYFRVADKDEEGMASDEDNKDFDETMDDQDVETEVSGNEDLATFEDDAVDSEEDDAQDLASDGGESVERNSTSGKLTLETGDGTKFDWTANSVFETHDDSATDQTSDVEVEPPKKKTKKSKKSYDDSAIDFDSKTPDSTSDFERLILGDPDSSAVWIQYVAYHMQTSEFEKAREVADRALKTINYRQESEKMNIWMALLNLENNFGTQESLESTFKRACEFNEPKEMYSRLVGTYIRSGKHDRAEETYEEMIKKFSHDPKIWLEHANYLAEHEKLDACRELLPKALRSLPKSEHVSVMQKFAQLEFKKGDAERGRTLFEGLLSAYPKRLDIWNVLIDMESIQLNLAGVRKLFDRVLATKLSEKKAKSVFKKWLLFEKEKGSEDDQEAVKARAAEYVRSHFRD